MVVCVYTMEFTTTTYVDVYSSTTTTTGRWKGKTTTSGTSGAQYFLTQLPAKCRASSQAKALQTPEIFTSKSPADP